MKSNTPTIISVIIAILLVGASIFFTSGSKTDKVSGGKTDGTFQKSTRIGAPGSEHSHISLLITTGDELVDLSQPQYMLKDPLVHFENGDGFVVHKHATGITISYFLDTLGIKMTEDCLTLDSGEEYCEDGLNKVRLLVNGKEVKDFLNYEIRHLDKILLDYSDGKEIDLKLKSNNIPPLLNELAEPPK